MKTPSIAKQWFKNWETGLQPKTKWEKMWRKEMQKYNDSYTKRFIY